METLFLLGLCFSRLVQHEHYNQFQTDYSLLHRGCQAAAGKLESGIEEGTTPCQDADVTVVTRFQACASLTLKVLDLVFICSDCASCGHGNASCLHAFCAMQKREAFAAKRKHIELYDIGAEDSIANASVEEQVRCPFVVLLLCCLSLPCSWCRCMLTLLSCTVQGNHDPEE